MKIKTDIQVATSLIDIRPGKSPVVTPDFVDQNQGRMIVRATPPLTLNYKVCLSRIKLKPPFRYQHCRDHVLAIGNAHENARLSSGESARLIKTALQLF